MATAETASLVAFPFVVRLVPSAASYHSGIGRQSVYAKFNDLRNLSAHSIFRAIFQIGAILFQSIRRMFVGTSTVIVTVAKITLHRIYTVKAEDNQEAKQDRQSTFHLA